jgi:hypothetical protein
MMSAASARQNDEGATSRFSQVWRITAQILLGVLVLSAVLSGSLRECFGQNGHHAIEWLHAGKFEPGKHDARTFQTAVFNTDMLRSAEPPCIDQLIFAGTFRADSPIEFRSSRPRHVPFVAMSRAHSIQSGFFKPSSTWQPFASRGVLDPALTTLRTIVLLN